MKTKESYEKTICLLDGNEDLNSFGPIPYRRFIRGIRGSDESTR